MTELTTAPPALADSERAARAAQQRSDLKRMRTVATGLLVLMLALFALAAAFQRVWPGLAYLRAFAEAGTVGACADWFAVVALFRRPFGLPIPHTAIIPRQKQRIGEALGRFIARNFLAPDEITARLDRLDLAGWLAAWLKAPENVKLVGGRLRGLLPPLLDLMGEDQVRAFSRAVVIGGVDSIALAPLLARTLQVLAAQGRFDPAFDWAAAAASRFLDAHAEQIRQRATKKGTSWIPGWIDVRLVNGIMGELQANLSAAQAEPDHPWRLAGRKALDRLIARLAEDPVLAEQCETVKRRVLDREVVEGWLEWLRGEVEARLRAELAAESDRVAGGLEHAMEALSRWLENDAHIRALINDWTQRLVLGAVVASRDEIGGFVSGVVARWDTDTLVERIELQVGRDLQYIRINGALVGGLVGLVIFTVSRLFGV
ncbi:MAG: DUF445 domain-containing protein [Caulobacteraceae bacterium]|nr:DUF445 domain-containing protein [Caulobacteraceae bacterium]